MPDVIPAVGGGSFLTDSGGGRGGRRGMRRAALIAHSLARKEEQEVQQTRVQPSGSQSYSFRAPRGTSEVALMAYAAFAFAAAASAAAGWAARGTRSVTVRAGLTAACVLGGAAVLAGQWESVRKRRASTSVCAPREAARNAETRDVRAHDASGCGRETNAKDGYETDEESEADPSDQIQHDTDNAWHLLKSYSLLTVRDSCGSIHRLLQV